MAFVEDLFKGNIVTGLAVGIGAVVLGPIVAPTLTAVLRPAAKAAIKAGIYVYDRGLEALAQANEMTGDIVAEARSEMTGEGVGETRSHAKPAVSRS
jgi:hypothetical protein